MKKTLMIILTLFFAYCNKGVNTEEAPSYKEKSFDIEADSRPLDSLIDPDSHQDLSDSMDAFSRRLFENLFDENKSRSENIMISPLSISLNLSILLNGADGATLDSMRNALSYSGLQLKTINSYLCYLQDELISNDMITLNIANSLWAQGDSMYLYESFHDIACEYYGAEVLPLTTADNINSWVKDKTNGKIDNMLEQIPYQTALIALNAVYFKGKWKDEFESKDTKPADFYTGEDTIEVEMMSIQEFFESKTHFTNSDYVVSSVRIPYKDEKTAMYIFLPDTGVNIQEWVSEKMSSKQSFDSLFSGYSTTEIELSMPRFEYSFSDTLNDNMKQFGMGAVFDSEKAGFNRIFSNVEGLALGSINHKTYIKVNEQGTEASAATIGGYPISAVMPFNVNRPFFFCIRDDEEGVILFMGTVKRPVY